MTTTNYGRWLNFRYLERNGILKKRLNFPPRWRASVRVALNNIRRTHYREEEPFYNPLYNGYKNQTIGSIQWLDFVVYIKEKKSILVILFDPRALGSGIHERTKIAFRKKCEHLSSKGVEYVILPKNSTVIEYQVLVMRKIRNMKGK